MPLRDLTRLHVLAAAVAAASVASCGSTTPETSRAELATPLAIDGAWQLVDGTVMPVEGGTIELVFDTELYEGVVYCNRVSGSIDRSEGLRFTNLVSETESCGPLLDINAGGFTQTLTSVNDAVVEGDGVDRRLVLSGELGELIFQPAP